MVVQLEKQTLLLVEDSEDDAFLFQWTLKEAGTAFCVHHVDNGAEAIDFLRTSSISSNLPAIILLDLKMPVLNGFEVLTWMQTQTFSHKVPVIVVSGSAQEEDKVRAKQLGALDYLVKPVTAADLRRISAQICPDAKGPKLAETGART
jgi:CheY-like chemotaxis protein